MSQEMEGEGNEIWGLGCRPDPAHETQTNLMVPSCKEEMYYCNIIFPFKKIIWYC